uniref:Putative secreted protein n=1 Tax=Amblyomma triste TaxID=251400 RepID=A0A023G366_AMBTT
MNLATLTLISVVIFNLDGNLANEADSAISEVADSESADVEILLKNRKIVETLFEEEKLYALSVGSHPNGSSFVQCIESVIEKDFQGNWARRTMGDSSTKIEKVDVIVSLGKPSMIVKIKENADKALTARGEQEKKSIEEGASESATAAAQVATSPMFSEYGEWFSVKHVDSNCVFLESVQCTKGESKLMLWMKSTNNGHTDTRNCIKRFRGALENVPRRFEFPQGDDNCNRFSVLLVNHI